MHDFTVWVSYGKWRKNWAIRYCLLHLIHLSSIRLRRCGRILSGICEPFCLITPDLTMHYCPILILIDYKILNTQRRTVIPTQAWVWYWVFQKNMKIAVIPSLQIPARAGMTMSIFLAIARSICPIRFILKITCFLNVPIIFCRSSLPSHKRIYCYLSNQSCAKQVVWNLFRRPVWLWARC